MIFQLFIGFLKVGLFAFGGAYGAIPLIRDVVLSFGWLTDEAFTNMIAVSESTPGPIMVNLATYVGSSQAGFLGALIATFAVVLPSFVVILALTAVFNNIIKNRFVQAALSGIKPAVIGIVLATGAHLFIKAALPGFEKADVRDFILAALLILVYFVLPKMTGRRISPIMLIVVSAALGAGVYTIWPL